MEGENVLKTDTDGNRLAQLIYLMALKCVLRMVKTPYFMCLTWFSK